MQKHHPVVKDENYNLYNDHIKKVNLWPCITRKEKINEPYDTDGVYYLLPFSQSNLIHTILSLTFFFFSCLAYPLLKSLTELGWGYFNTHLLLNQWLENDLFIFIFKSFKRFYFYLRERARAWVRVHGGGGG